MRFNDIYLAGVASWLPPREPIGQGHYEPGVQDEHAYESVTVASADQTPPEMAIRAGRLALTRSGVDPATVSLLIHAFVWYQGLDMWSASSYIQHALLGQNRLAQPIDLNGQCSGAVSALQLAADHLVADPDRRAAVVTTADRFLLPAFDRWHSEGPHINFGDGAAAVVLTRGRGFARLLAVRSVTDTTLEPMYRGQDTFTTFSPAAQGALDLETRKAVLEEELGMPETVALLNRGLADAVYGVLEEAGLTMSDVSRLVFPNVGLSILTDWLELFGIDLSQTLWELGRTTGHVGAADPITGLTHLLEQGQLAVGERVVLVGIGAGFTWACALVECVEKPDWSAAA